jgi:hypothetical protein
MMKSSAAEQKSGFGGQRDAGEDFDHSAVVFFGKPGGAGLHEHLVRGAGKR